MLIQQFIAELHELIGRYDPPRAARIATYTRCAEIIGALERVKTDLLEKMSRNECEDNGDQQD